MGIEEDKQRYMAAAHAMQAGVKVMQNYDPRATGGVDLRVGVNAAMVDNGSLAKLLIDKGIITEAELYKALAEGMESEKARYEDELQEKTGSKIVLV